MRPSLLLALALVACGSSPGADPDAGPPDAGGFSVDHPTQLVDGLVFPNALLTDGEALYVVTDGQSAAQIRRFDLQTRELTTLATSTGMGAQLAIDDAYVYWVNADTYDLHRVSKH